MTFPPLRWFRDTVTVEELVGHNAYGEMYDDPVEVRCSVNREDRQRLPSDAPVDATRATVLVPIKQPDGSLTVLPKPQSKVTLEDGTVAELTQLSVEEGPHGQIVAKWKLT